MAPKGSGTAKNAKTAKKQKGSPSGLEDLGRTSMVPYSPEIPGVGAPGEPSELGAAASPTLTPPVYVTEKVLASTLGGLEQKLAALFAASLPERKRARSPSPRVQYLATENFSLEEVDFPGDQADEDLEGSDSEESTIETPFSKSQAEKLWIQSLADMVHSAFKLPLPEPAVSAVSSLGSLKAPQAGFFFPSFSSSARGPDLSGLDAPR